MLFSEPKIPQFWTRAFPPTTNFVRFSALQRAENSSISRVSLRATVSRRFSALQRAENSSIHRRAEHRRIAARRFSALQRAENSSILMKQRRAGSTPFVSVLFSEPKIPQLQAPRARAGQVARFSALQRAENSSIDAPAFFAPQRLAGFSALQRAENSSISTSPARPHEVGSRRFSALQRAENSSILGLRRLHPRTITRFSALQRAENSSIRRHPRLGAA